MALDENGDLIPGVQQADVYQPDAVQRKPSRLERFQTGFKKIAGYIYPTRTSQAVQPPILAERRAHEQRIRMARMNVGRLKQTIEEERLSRPFLKKEERMSQKEMAAIMRQTRKAQENLMKARVKREQSETQLTRKRIAGSMGAASSLVRQMFPPAFAGGTYRAFPGTTDEAMKQQKMQLKIIKARQALARVQARRSKGPSLRGRYGRVGRPPGQYSHISPITGKPIHVYQWRKEQRAVQRRDTAMQAIRQQRYAASLARRGMPPQQAYMMAQQAEMNKQMQLQQQAMQEQPQLVPQQQMIVQPRSQFQQQRAIPPMSAFSRENKLPGFGNTPPPAINPFPQQQTVGQQQLPPGYYEDVDMMTGRRIIRQRPQAERWTQ